MPSDEERVLKLASDGYYNDVLEAEEFDRILISESDGMSYEYEAVPTEDGTILLRKVDEDD